MADANNPPRWSERVLNTLAGLVGLWLVFLLAGSLINHYQHTNTLRPGSTLVIPGMDWSTSDRNLVIALQVGCRWCESSAPFYRSLLSANGKGQFRPIAVLPQPPEEAKSYLQTLGINIRELHQSTLNKLGVNGTPSLILVDRSGHVLSTWLGQLSPTLQDDVYSTLGVTAPLIQESHITSYTHGYQLATADVIKSAQQDQKGFTIVDLDPRGVYERKHLRHSINVPLDEIEIRAPHELSRTRELVVYCGYRLSCQPASKGEPLQTFCAADVATQSYCDVGLGDLYDQGFRNVSVVSDDMTRLTAKGVDVAVNEQ